jgi:hypothetical protein
MYCPCKRHLFGTEKDLQSFIWTRRAQLDEFRKLGLTSFQQQASQLWDHLLRVRVPVDRGAHDLARVQQVSAYMPRKVRP